MSRKIGFSTVFVAMSVFVTAEAAGRNRPSDVTARRAGTGAALDQGRSCAPQPPIEASLSVVGAPQRGVPVRLLFAVTPQQLLRNAEIVWEIPDALPVAGGAPHHANLRLEPFVQREFDLLVQFDRDGEFEVAAQIVERGEGYVYGRRARVYFTVAGDDIAVAQTPRWSPAQTPARPLPLGDRQVTSSAPLSDRFAGAEPPATNRPHSDDDPPPNGPGPGQARITGHFYYRHHDGTGHGAWNSIAQIWDRDVFSSDDLLAEVIVSSSGFFDSGWFDNTNDTDLFDGPRQDIYIRWRSENGRVRVQDYFGTGVFTVQLDWTSNIADGIHDVGGWIIDSDGPGNYPDDGIEGAFEVCETLSVGWLHYNALGRDLDLVVCEWAPGSTEGAYYQGSARRIRLPDGDHFDPSVIHHEYGHHVMQIAKGGFPPGSGGPHGWFDCISEGLAWSEGWASYSGQSTLNDPVYSATGGFGDGGGSLMVDLEATTGDCLLPGPGGTDGEASVASFLWDVFDDLANDFAHPCDSLALGADEIWDAFENGGTIDDMIDFGLAWLDRGHGHDAAFHALLANHNIWPRNDADDDCVPDDWDSCPDTPTCAQVDANGCPLDDDRDGVANGCDSCPDTPACAEVNAAGCPLDADGDGVPNGCDVCPDTPVCAEVDAAGCPLDDDQDGVPNGCDACPDFDDNVDFDGDGFADACDNCPTVPNPGQEDYNNDGLGDACDCNDNGVSDDADVRPSIGFEPAVNYATGDAQKGVAAGDLDNDNDIDVVVASHGDDQLIALINLGDGNFSAAGPFPTGEGTGPWDVTLGDFNGDGLLDAAVANILPTTISILYSTGFGFSAPQSIDVGAAQESIVAGDFNNDTFVDLATANQDGSIAVLLNDGTGQFALASVVVDADILADVIVADLNGDNALDLVATLRFSNQVAVLLNDGAANFSIQKYPVGDYPIAACAVDVDGNGTLDLAVANSAEFGGSPGVSILLNDGTGVMSPVAAVAAGSRPYGIAAADFDGDGDNDLAVTDNANGTVNVLANHGAAVFGPYLSFVTDPQSAGVLVAQLDGARTPDLVVANFSTTSVLLAAPGAPVSDDRNGNGIPDECELPSVLSDDSVTDRQVQSVARP